MKSFIVAIPLFNSQMAVEAYWLCSRRGQKILGMLEDHRNMEDTLSYPGLELVESIGVEPFTGGCPLIVEVNEYQLLMGAPENHDIPPDKLICMLSADINISEVLLTRCRKIKENGYAIAVDGLIDVREKAALFDLVDCVNIDLDVYGIDRAMMMAKIIKKVNKRMIISQVPDTDTYNKLSDLPATLFTGGFYSKPVTKGIKDISPIKINTLALMNQINEEDFDLTDIAAIIGRDPSLSISLLRFINSSSAKFTSKINSIRSAVAILGQKEVKRWATAALSLQLAQDRPGEISKLSLIRARFAENLAAVFEMGLFAPSLFVTGLFSLLDVILQKPMPEAVKEVALDEKVRQALVEKSGDYYQVLDLLYAYERADWDTVSVMILKHDLKVEDIVEAFIEALVWYKRLLEAIDEEPSE